MKWKNENLCIVSSNSLWICRSDFNMVDAKRKSPILERDYTENG